MLLETRTTPTGSVFGNPDFRWLYAAGAVSQLGTQVSYVAIPLVAVLALDAGPAQVGLLAALSTAAFLLIGLPAGAWVDRMRRRGVMVAADLLRAGLLLSVPVAWWSGVLTLAQLYAVVLLAGAATVFFDVANQSYLPHVVGRDQLPAANAALVTTAAAGNVAGRSAGGLVVALLGAPVAVAVDAVSYLLSALCVTRVRRPEPTRTGQRRGLLSEIREGLRYVAGHPVLRTVATSGALANLSVQLYVVLLPVWFTRHLGLGTGVLGLYLAVGGVGAFLGALLAARIGRWLGHGRALWLVGLAAAPFGLLLPLVGRGGWLWLAGLGWLVTAMKMGVDNVIAVSFRQRVTPDDLLGRMNASFRFLLTGALALGAGLAGLVGEYAGTRTALWLAAAGLALVWLPVFRSPLRRIRDLPG